MIGGRARIAEPNAAFGLDLLEVGPAVGCKQERNRELVQWPAKYAATKGLPFAAVTDGRIWAFFKASRTDGVPPVEGKALVYPDLTAIETHFTEFYELLGQGNGLAGTELIMKRNAGALRLWSCGTMVQINEKGRRFSEVPNVNGVGLVLTSDVRHPIDLSETWLGQPNYTYIDREAEKLEDSGAVLRVVGECESVGSREPARRLRNKIMAMMPELNDQPIVFDFDGCRAPSSSFFDELFGRMALEMGLETFQRRCSIRGLDGSLIDRANVVIDQRVRQGDSLPNWDDSDEEPARLSFEELACFVEKADMGFFRTHRPEHCAERPLIPRLLQEVCSASVRPRCG